MTAIEENIPYWQIFLSNCLHLAGITIYYYDYLLTASDEYNIMWKASRSIGSWLYFANRYFSFFVNIIVLYGSFGRFTHVKLFQVYLIPGCSPYCVSNNSRPATRVVLGTWTLGITLFAIGTWASVKTTGNDSGMSLFEGCHVAINTLEGAARTAVAWESLFVFDVAVFILTFWKELAERTQSLVRPNNVLIYVVRQGSVYFVVMAIAHLANIVTFYALQPELRGTLSTLASNVSVILISRLMLGLQKTAQGYLSGTGTTADAGTTTRGKSHTAMFTTLPTMYEVQEPAASGGETGSPYSHEEAGGSTKSHAEGGSRGNYDPKSPNHAALDTTCGLHFWPEKKTVVLFSVNEALLELCMSSASSPRGKRAAPPTDRTDARCAPFLASLEPRTGSSFGQPESTTWSPNPGRPPAASLFPRPKRAISSTGIRPQIRRASVSALPRTGAIHTVSGQPKAQRTSKTSHRLVELPSAPQTRPLPPDEEEQFQHGYETDRGVRDVKSEGERMSKEQRRKAGFKRITAYCVAEGFKMNILASFLKREHNVQPRIFDEAMHVMYHLPLLPGYGPGSNIRSSVPPPASTPTIDYPIPQPSDAENHPEEGLAYFSVPSRSAELEGFVTSGSPHIASTSPQVASSPPHPEFMSETEAHTPMPPSEGTPRPSAKQLQQVEPDSFAEAVFFAYGVAVFFGLDENQEQSILEDIQGAGVMQKALKEERWEIEECHFEYNPYIAYPRIYNDFFTFKYHSVLSTISVAHALAQSTLLARYETLAHAILSSEETTSIPTHLALTGKLKLSRTEALKITGKLFKLRRDVNLVSNVLDVPEVFWEEGQASVRALYDAVRDYMEISIRVGVLNEKLAVAEDLLGAIHDSLNEHVMDRITWIIIWLIVVACLVEFGEVLARLVVHATGASRESISLPDPGTIANMTREEAIWTLQQLWITIPYIMVIASDKTSGLAFDFARTSFQSQNDVMNGHPDILAVCIFIAQLPFSTMSSGAGSTPKVTTKSGGNPRTMAIGMAVVAAALGGFYYTQFYVHKRDDQTCSIYAIMASNRIVDDGFLQARAGLPNLGIQRDDVTEAQPTPKVGGSPRTMLIGMGFVGSCLLAFYFAQFRVHKNDNQTWIARHGQQPGNDNPAVPGQYRRRIISVDKNLEPSTRSSSVPLRGSGDKSESVRETLMSVALGKGTDPDPSVPENPGNMQEPTPQRRNSSGSHYTKAGYYAESYKKRPEDPNAPKQGRS
ncbi:hypothetical protein NM688_g379 [Phlebia brevispora]|uniref:Uncharacterized protein n=1 Tax=Phlebia brevispora TaxID=194682 RepID=A0ACC1TED0_9APHY|nr:hypothetical protein NM688_g379 [Phlebia brevispora]